MTLLTVFIIQGPLTPFIHMRIMTGSTIQIAPLKTFAF